MAERKFLSVEMGEKMLDENALARAAIHETFIESNASVIRDYAFVDSSTPRGDADVKETARLYVLARRGESEAEIAELSFLETINFASLGRRLGSLLASAAGNAASISSAKQEFIDFDLVPTLCYRLRLCNHTLYMSQAWGYWSRVASAAVFPKLCQTVAKMLPALGMTQPSKVKALTETIEIALTTQPSSECALIQFSDCVLSDGVPTQDPPQSFPRYFFDVKIWDAVKTGRPSVYVQAVDDLLMHLANGDSDVAESLIKRLSMSFIPSGSLKNTLGPTIAVLYGPTAANGKSTLAKLCMRAFNNQNVSTFSFSQFKGYELTKLRNNLLLIDMEASGVYVDSEVSTVLKQAVTADTVSTRDIYKSPEQTVPLVQFLVCTNAAPKAEDKTHGWGRRLEWYEVEEPLPKFNETWWADINSDDAARYLREKLILTAIDLCKKPASIDVPEKVIEANTRYLEMNNNVSRWVESLRCDGKSGKSALVNMPVGCARDLYESWCDESSETALGKTSFNRIIQTEFKLLRKNRTVVRSEQPEVFDWWVLKDESQSQSRQFEDKHFMSCWVSASIESS